MYCCVHSVRSISEKTVESRATLGVRGGIWVRKQTVVLAECSACTIARGAGGPLLWGFMNTTAAAATRPGRARRRSKRLRLTVPVDVIAFEGQKELFREAAQMQCVNAHGGLVVIAGSVAIGQVLTVVNRNTREQQDCRVVNVETAENSKWAAGIEFLQPAGNFWQISFPQVIPRFAQDNCN
jgi:hypothetical protein